mmetsp:Transcript_5221/g.14018  ORF Transcript_5221/g.14018 Transcript_5221/m.14018 type:complete len:322 (+) Transcript_5221:32-997(+)
MALSDDEKARVTMLLKTVTCGKLVESQKPITIPADASIEAACEVLATNGILSALVVAPDGEGFAGVFSYRSLLHYFLKQYPAGEDAPPSLASLDLRAALMKATPDIKAADFCRERNREIHILRPEQPLKDAVELFGSGIHRCSVVDSNSAVKGVLSQSLALRYIAQHLIELKDVVGKPISSFDALGAKPAIYIESRRNVIEGMELMYKHKLSAVAVVDNAGKLSGNLSLSDIKYVFRTRSYQMLWYTVASFVKLLREKMSLEQNAGMDTFPFFDITRDKSLNLAIQKIVATRVHHLWIVNQEGKPTGVISITDVMRCLTGN